MTALAHLVHGAAGSDPIWSRLRDEAEIAAAADPALAPFMRSGISEVRSLEEAVGQRMGQRLGSAHLTGDAIRLAFVEACRRAPQIGAAIRADIAAVLDRDPATTRALEPVMYYKGFHALQAHRLAHWLWRSARADFALLIQSLSSEVFQVDIHPAVPLGQGLFLDHATGLVVGATATIADDVSILQDVTLGGTGKETGDRHPKIRRGVLIGAGAKVLGNIEIGACARIAAGAVVLAPVPPNCTVAGVPAKVIGQAGCREPSKVMDHMLPTHGASPT
jgi:serine O-acetyltransferase